MCFFIRLTPIQPVKAACVAKRDVHGQSRTERPIVPGQKYFPGQGQEQKSWDKLLCPGTSRDKITFPPKKQRTRKGHSKTGKGRCKTGKERSKTGKYILKQEKDVLKQEKMF